MSPDARDRLWDALWAALLLGGCAWLVYLSF
jgi:hypothetical protein